MFVGEIDYLHSSPIVGVEFSMYAPAYLRWESVKKVITFELGGGRSLPAAARC
jgi:hypothetical protein